MEVQMGTPLIIMLWKISLHKCCSSKKKKKIKTQPQPTQTEINNSWSKSVKQDSDLFDCDIIFLLEMKTIKINL